MQLCKYSKQTGCTECQYTFYSQCKKFWQVHARFLLRNILREKSDAFKYTPIKNTEKHNVLCSRKMDLAKSVALQFAMEKNSEVVPYTTATVLDLVVHATEEINSPVSYLTITKATGANDVIMSMIQSFVDIAVKNGGKVAICIDKNCPYEFKYPKPIEA